MFQNNRPVFALLVVDVVDVVDVVHCAQTPLRILLPKG